MSSKMLIDASHPEETRVVVVRGNRVEEFDFESASKRQLRGNIYLAKVMRVEPSLQAAFVDYGGNRHGFLAFSEIHPDYYQIPIADRQALIEEEASAERDVEEDIARPLRRGRRRRRGERNGQLAEKRRDADPSLSEAAAREITFGTEGIVQPEAESEDSERGTFEVESIATVHSPALSLESPDLVQDEMGKNSSGGQPGSSEQTAATPLVEPATEPAIDLVSNAQLTEEPERTDPIDINENGQILQANWAETGRFASDIGSEGEEDGGEIEQLGGDAMEEVPVRPLRPRRQYKIQEVIKRRQVLLVQVVKEERGNKGAALTTYLSLAGRYSVLMPNTARGGGISRKITDPTDRKRLKSIAQELEVPEGMGVIVRTAGASRTKAELKRDFEYLMRMWETVRGTTLQSSAPTLVYEEGSLIKRSIRDLYNKDIDEITVAGEDGYREAKEFMRLLMPSHAKMVQPYRDRAPMFAKFGVETQLDAMFSNQVTLKSGGYIVINQTEALVAVDVNSGRSTREHNIEDTALRTNLEAADEISRQLRLRDLAGLIVIDFIDMEEGRNNRTVERRLKDALKNDRARIQIGRMSHFGLLEMSRQRMRAGVIEGSTIACPQCAGAGTVRSTASIALHVLRALEDALIKNSDYDLIVKARTSVALYILNQKRSHLRDLEQRFGVSLTIAADDSLTNTTYCTLQRGEPAAGAKETTATTQLEALNVPLAEELVPTPRELQAAAVSSDAEAQVDGDELRESESEAYGRQRRRRRRRRGRGSDRDTSGIAANAPQPPDDALAAMVKLVQLGPIAASASEVATESAAPFSKNETEANHRSPRGRLRGGKHIHPPKASGEEDSGTADVVLLEFESEPGAPAPGGDSPISENVAANGKRQRGRRAPRAGRGAGGSKTAAKPAVDPGFEDHDQREAPAVTNEILSPPEDMESEQSDVRGSRPLQSNAPLKADQARAHLEEATRPDPDPLRPKRSGWWQRARAGWRG
jgi:ribonuclease E